MILSSALILVLLAPATPASQRSDSLQGLLAPAPAGPKLIPGKVESYLEYINTVQPYATMLKAVDVIIAKDRALSPVARQQISMALAWRTLKEQGVKVRQMQVCQEQDACLRTYATAMALLGKGEDMISFVTPLLENYKNKAIHSSPEEKTSLLRSLLFTLGYGGGLQHQATLAKAAGPDMEAELPLYQAISQYRMGDAEALGKLKASHPKLCTPANALYRSYTEPESLLKLLEKKSLPKINTKDEQVRQQLQRLFLRQQESERFHLATCLILKNAETRAKAWEIISACTDAGFFNDHVYDLISDALAVKDQALALKILQHQAKLYAEIPVTEQTQNLRLDTSILCIRLMTAIQAKEDIAKFIQADLDRAGALTQQKAEALAFASYLHAVAGNTAETKKISTELLALQKKNKGISDTAEGRMAIFWQAEAFATLGDGKAARDCINRSGIESSWLRNHLEATLLGARIKLLRPAELASSFSMMASSTFGNEMLGNRIYEIAYDELIRRQYLDLNPQAAQPPAPGVKTTSSAAAR